MAARNHEELFKESARTSARVTPARDAFSVVRRSPKQAQQAGGTGDSVTLGVCDPNHRRLSDRECQFDP